jgi:hypothetical protein
METSDKPVFKVRVSGHSLEDLTKQNTVDQAENNKRHESKKITAIEGGSSQSEYSTGPSYWCRLRCQGITVGKR